MDDEILGPQHYKAILDAVCRDYDLTCPATIVSTQILNREIRTRLRFNSLFEICEFVLLLRFLCAKGNDIQAEADFGIWSSDGVMEVFELRLTPPRQ